MRRIALPFLTALLVGAPAATLAHDRPVASGWNVRSQYDRPGDYRCDAYWDAARTDCDARWRDQRRYSSHGHDDRGGPANRRWTSYPRGYGRASGADVWPGAYGRPDLVYSSGGRDGARDPRRIDWCRSAYRSYDPASGYYRTYDGQLTFCG